MTERRSTAPAESSNTPTTERPTTVAISAAGPETVPLSVVARLKQRLASVTGSGNAENRRLTKDGISTTTVRMLGLATAVGVDIATARLLSPSEAGVFFLLLSILSFASVMATAGLGSAIIRFVSENVGIGKPAAARRALTLGLRIALVAIPLTTLICCLFLIFGGARLLSLPVPSILIPLLALNILALPLLQTTASALRSFHETWLATLLTGQNGGPASNLMFLTALVGIALIVKPTAASALTLNAIAMFLMVPISLYVLRRVANSRLSAVTESSVAAPTPTLMMMLSVCLPLTLNQFFSYCTGFGDLWIAGSTVSHEQFALYAAARRLMLLIGLPLQLVSLTIVASISELHAQGRIAALQRMLRNTATLAVVPSLIGLLTLIAFADRIAGLTFGAYYAAAATPLRLLCLGQIAFVCAGSAELTLIMTGRQRLALFVNLGTTVALAIGGTLAARRFGITGLAAANAAVIALQVGLFCLCTRRSLGIWTAVDLVHGVRLLKNLRSKPGKPREDLSCEATIS